MHAALLLVYDYKIAQSGVARIMASRVVNPLEMVQIGHQQRQGMGKAPGPLDFLNETLLEGSTAHGPGQKVCARQAIQFLFQALMFGDIGKGADKAATG